MNRPEMLEAVNARYSSLAESECCLSCGGAVTHAEAGTGEVCVDLGSGRGRDVLRMAEAVGATGHAFGIDASEGMLEKARETATRLGVANATFLRADLHSLPLESKSVDLVISNCTINHAADKQAVWNEIHRVLKPGGRFVVSDIYATREVPPEFAADAQAIAECWAGAVTREQYFSQLAHAGFIQVEVREESAPYPKGRIEVASMTIIGIRPGSCCCCGTK
jgi:arsenite methyltransferase